MTTKAQSGQVVQPANVSLLRQRLHMLLIDKMNRAGWQTHFTPCVQKMKLEFLMRYCNVTTSKRLDAEACEAATQRLREITIAPPTLAIHQRPTIQQRKAIVRLGRYVLGPVYGDKWFWKMLPDWVHEYWGTTYDHETDTDLSKRKVTRIDDLTRDEARYVIQRLEKVEARLKTTGRAS